MVDLAVDPLSMPGQRAGSGWSAAWVGALVALPFLAPWTGGPSVSVWQFLVSGLCAALLLLRPAPALPARPLGAWLGLCAAAVVLGQGQNAAALWGALGAIGCVAVAACVGAGLARAGGLTLRGVAWGLCAAGVLSAVAGVVQYYGHAAAFGPLLVSPHEGIGMAYGNLRQRNQFATLLAVALVAALWLHAQAPAGASRRRLLWWAGASAVLVVGLAASSSRTGLLELLGIVGVAAWRAQRERRAAPPGVRLRWPPPVLLLAALALYGLASWALPWLAAAEAQGMLVRLRDGAPPGHGRLLLWGNVIELIGQHPWRGWGWGELSHAHYSHLYAGERFVEILDHAHNLPLHLAVELGVPAAVLICGGFAWLVVAAKPWAERDPACAMAWGVLGVIGLHSLLEYPLWYGPFQLLAGLCLGVLWPGGGSQRFKRNRLPSLVIPALAAMLFIAMLGAVAWDYTRVSQIYRPQDARLAAWRTHTMDKLRGRSWFFGDTVKFAELTLTPVTRANAKALYALAGEMLHFSPEARVVTRRIEAAALLGSDDEVAAQLARFRAAYPEEYIRWLGGRAPAK